MQINLTLSEIQNLATNGKIYARGKALSQSTNIRDLYYLSQTHALIAKVQSSNSDILYTVQIQLSQRDRPKRISCTCAAARQYLGCCKHMVAVLIRAMNHKLEDLPLWTGDLPESLDNFSQNRKPYFEKSASDAQPVAEALPPPPARLVRQPESSLTAQDNKVRQAEIEQNTTTSSSTDPFSNAEQAATQRLMQLRAVQARDLTESLELQSSEAILYFELHLQLPRLTSETALLNAQIRLERGSSVKHYKIKQMEEFLHCFATGQHYFFGQSLDFDPKVQHFDVVGERLLSWLLRLWNWSVERQPYEYLARNSFFNAGSVSLNPQRLWDFFSAFSEDFEDLSLQVSWGQNDPPVRAEIFDHFPPLQFLWAKSPHRDYDLVSLTLSKSGGEKVHVYSPQALKAKEDTSDLRLLTRDAALLLYDKKIYRLASDNAETATARLLLVQLALSDGQRLDFSPKHAGEFLTRVYPALTKDKLLTLAPEQAESLLCEDLKAYLWLDQEGKGIRAQLGFAYGNYLFNPHPSAENICIEATDGPNSMSGESVLEVGTSITAPIIIRDHKKEARCLGLIKQYNFLTQAIQKKSRSTLLDRVDSSHGNQVSAKGRSAYYLFGEAALMNFLAEGLAAFQEVPVELYLSRRFKQLMLKPLAAFTGRLRLEQGSNLLRVELKDWPYSNDDMRQILAAYREKRNYARLKDGSFVKWSGAEAAEAAGEPDATAAGLSLLDTFDLWGAKLDGDELVLPAYRAVPLAKLLQGPSDASGSSYSGFGAVLNTDESSGDLTAMLQDLSEPGRLSFDVPEQLNKTLRNYQKAGFKWLCMLDYYGFGGILADDMGLGKTLQTLTYIAHLRKTRPEPVLVAAPTSLIYNWLAEADKFLPGMKVLLLEGNKKTRLAQISTISEAELVVCSYAVLRQDIKELRTNAFSAFFIDEAQFIKNPLTQTARAVKKINAQRHFALTGTPIENGLSELWSIFDFLMPGYLFNQRQFQDALELPIMREQDEAALAQLRLLTEPFILRRLKKDVLKELPDKIETELLCDMTAAQDKLYFAYLSGARQELGQIRDEAEYRKSQMQVLTLLTRLRQLCCHPALFLNQYDGGSGKLDALDELLDRLMEGGHNSLIFSQFTGLLHLVEERLKAKQLPYYYLDGAVPAKERLNMADRFNSGAVPIFLISLRAGGTGLNLTGADTVIHLDPWWNPAVEDQATDRAHRIGQRKVVQIFRFISRGSIEEKITALKDEKRQLVSSVIQSGEDGLQKLSLAELRDLLA